MPEATHLRVLNTAILKFVCESHCCVGTTSFCFLVHFMKTVLVQHAIAFQGECAAYISLEVLQTYVGSEVLPATTMKRATF
jgi:hypothetical protein